MGAEGIHFGGSEGVSVNIIQGDCLTVLPTLPTESVHCVVTSPPYWRVRDYGHADQMGWEASPNDYVKRMVAVFHEVRRTLRADGTVWVNLGDTTNNRRRIRGTSHQPSLNGFREGTWAEATKAGLTQLSINDGDLKEKDMCGVPWLFAFAMRRDGWFLRQEIIWAKSFGKPEPTKDRLPNRHEQLFLFSKSKNHYFDRSSLPTYATGSVWQVPPIGRSDHAASFAEALVRPCVSAGCPKGGTVLDPFSGSGTTGKVAADLGREAILIELNSEYIENSRARIKGEKA